MNFITPTEADIIFSLVYGLGVIACLAYVITAIVLCYRRPLLPIHVGIIFGASLSIVPYVNWVVALACWWSLYLHQRRYRKYRGR